MVRSAWVTDPFADATVSSIGLAIGGERDELTVHVFLAAAVGATYVLPAMQTIRGNQATTKDEQARCNNLEACKERKSKLERRYDTGG